MTESNTNQPLNKDELVVINKLDINMDVTPKFGQVLEAIPSLVRRGESIMEKDMSEFDEDEIKAFKTELKQMKQFERAVEESLKMIRASFNTKRDTAQTMLKNALNQSGYKELQGLNDEISNREKAVLVQREQERWEELSELFERTARGFKQLDIFFTRPEDYVEAFYIFKQNGHQKLVTGAKNKNVTKTVRETVTSYVARMESDITTILSLRSIFQDELIQNFRQHHDVNQTVRFNTQKMNAYEEAKRKEEERLEKDRIAKEKAEEKKKKIEALRQESLKKKPVQTEEKATEKKPVETQEKPGTEGTPNSHILMLSKVYDVFSEISSDKAGAITDEQAEVYVNRLRQILQGD